MRRELPEGASIERSFNESFRVSVLRFVNETGHTVFCNCGDCVYGFEKGISVRLCSVPLTYLESNDVSGFYPRMRYADKLSMRIRGARAKTWFFLQEAGR